MLDNDNKLEFDEVWKALEEQDTTGAYKRAREVAGIAREQLEYAYNSGYEAAKAEYERTRGEWIPLYPRTVGEWEYKCSNCNNRGFMRQSNFCPDCGADMREGGAE